MHIVTVAEMRELEEQADKQYGLTSPTLMQNAGKSAATIFETHILRHNILNSTEILFLIGPGNNGGDGMVMARYLAQKGAQVSIYHWKEHHLIVHEQDIPAQETDQRLEALVQDVAYIVDGLLGTGRSRPLPEDMRVLLKRVRAERARRPQLRVVAIDLPTGVNADTGEVDPGAIKADATITLDSPKRGFFFFPARDYIGELYIGSIGLPPEIKQHLTTEMLSSELVRDVLPQRELNSNKGTFGKIMLFCGSPPYPGSAFLAGSGAARVGAGLVTLAVTEQLLPVYASSFHEATFVLLPHEDAGSFQRAQTLIDHLHGYRAILIGPGLGQSSNTREMILQILEYLRAQPDGQRPHLVIDADGLNNLSALEHWWTLLPQGTIITPHPGEMSRLIGGTKVSGGGIDRLELARAKASEWNLILLLKGACTLIAHPDGRLRINWHANPALATAGTGDVLAGMITGLLSQGLDPFDAASTGVYLHAIASKLVSETVGNAGLLASDLLAHIPRAINKMSTITTA